MKYVILNHKDFVMVGPVQIIKEDNPNWEEQAKVWSWIWDKREYESMPSRPKDDSSPN